MKKERVFDCEFVFKYKFEKYFSFFIITFCTYFLISFIFIIILYVVQCQYIFYDKKISYPKSILMILKNFLKNSEKVHALFLTPRQPQFR
ncbi:unnamed protein product [Meloidogyne enterolobii]|uniref:Uncharacterized protein n=1 Tax=Meloidogyne enterolobii TaxID=390850 RepID=A0ACB1B6F7_MELEN